MPQDGLLLVRLEPVLLQVSYVFSVSKHLLLGYLGTGAYCDLLMTACQLNYWFYNAEQ